MAPTRKAATGSTFDLPLAAAETIPPIFALLAVMLKRGWMVRYLPPIAEGRGEGLMVAFGYAWAGLMFLTAAANLVLGHLGKVGKLLGDVLEAQCAVVAPVHPRGRLATGRR